MRIWNQTIIKNLCSKHLVAMWREGIIMYYGIIENKSGWKNHPARKEFENCPDKLWERLRFIKLEADKRGFNFHSLPDKPVKTNNEPKEWQSLAEQIEVLKVKRQTIKSCKCAV